MINIFRGDYGWLSNMTSVSIHYMNYDFNSVESAYLWSKNPTDPLWLNKCLNNPPNIVKRDSRGMFIREDWDDVKLDIMLDLLYLKFNQEPFKSKLIATGNENIQEGNMWNDRFYGVDLSVNPNVGENHLGRLIMKIRDELNRK